MQRRDPSPESASAARFEGGDLGWEPPSVPPSGPASWPVSSSPAGQRPRFEGESEVLSVSELDRRLKRLLEGSTANLRVEGEVSGLKRAPSGHAYFALKDEREEACIECVMYRTAGPRSLRALQDGERVVVTGKASLYVPRGRLQFIVESAAPAGRGALLEALERLKEQLAAEGLFALERKRPLPREPRVIGVVTSGSGAVIHDIVKVAFRRGGARVLLARALVQGPGASAQICRAIGLLEQVPEVDVIIVGRGGGSADDLSAFNDEAVVRRVAQARVPVVSAVGHEVDVSLTDLCADARAATPSQAAELLVPDAGARRRELGLLSVRLSRAVGHTLAAARADLDRRVAALGSPERLLAEPQQEVDELRGRLERAMERRISGERAGLAQIERRLAGRHPRAVIAGARADLGPLLVRLGAATRRYVRGLRGRFAEDVARLSAMSPLSVLARGYAITTDASGRAILDARTVAAGERIVVRVHEGSLRATVTASAGPGEPLGEGTEADGGGSNGGSGGGGMSVGGVGSSGGRARGVRAPRRRAARIEGEQLRLGLEPSEEPRSDG
ncbi:exodeoxyribonuclease VII large subunit [Chondromyces apiculatus]|uniref:Exodeoxyribonuclease 7 large subunit n=1 Tax=Chondromyces apiculatus DSM 436 TaxID=1192034 RepID=A0A017T8E7_9BACT|nr:exodeoxyribonuclease VII large subunit [Chondromyces apiculatus]EYF05252.1 Exodeoxyribonuclease VII large subunit [Chondromyces apiculatus DSM 436]